MTNFEDIRPYRDEEVPATISRLLADAEFIQAMTAFTFSHWPHWTHRLLRPVVKGLLKRDLGKVSSVRGVQDLCSGYLDRIIVKTTAKITISGLENLRPGKPCLFISNHRDIVMDPAFVNYALYHNGFETVRIAIGDNLLQKPFVSDLMRLNKSFIVKRSVTGVREKMKSSLTLSDYIYHSIEEGCPIWISQREGRAKDGIDRTDPAIIKMLYMSQKKREVSFSDYMNWLHIVPVVISYEYNPCDLLIANEMHQIRQYGSYHKKPGEDLLSIVTGITGYKGHIHVAFGTPLSGELITAETVAAAIDRQMIDNNLFHPSNQLAAAALDPSFTIDDGISAAKQEEFNQRLNRCEEALRPYFLALYGNALIQQSSRR